jgi:hypothetical protein
VADDGHRLITRVAVSGPRGDLVELADRAQTLSGDLHLAETEAGLVATLTLPYDG